MNCPNSSCISGLELEKAVLGEVNRIVGEYCQAEDIETAGIHSIRLKELEKELNILRERQTAAEKRLVRMYRDRLDGVISEEDYSLFRRSLSEEEKALAERAERISRQAEECRRRNDSAEEKSVDSFTHFDVLTRSIADEFIDYIEIGMKDEKGGREIHIYWKV